MRSHFMLSYEVRQRIEVNIKVFDQNPTRHEYRTLLYRRLIFWQVCVAQGMLDLGLKISAFNSCDTGVDCAGLRAVGYHRWRGRWGVLVPPLALAQHHMLQF